MACIYILQSTSTGKFYVGSSHADEALDRLKAHNVGKTRSTKAGRPWIIVHKELYPSYYGARRRELFLKSGVGRSWIKENVKL